MKRALTFIALAALLTAALRAHGEDARDTPEAQTQAAALAWLALIDAGDYASSWDSAAAYFQRQIAQNRWGFRAGEIRRQFGAVKARRISSVGYTRSVQHGPPGEYIVAVFSTTFAHQGVVTKIVTQMKDSDGRWRVGGYVFVPQGCPEPIPQTFACGAYDLFIGAQPRIIPGIRE